MNHTEYRNKVWCAQQMAGSGPGWNARFLYGLDIFGLCLRPELDTDTTGRGNDMYAPLPALDDQVTWPVSRIREKNG